MGSWFPGRIRALFVRALESSGRAGLHVRIVLLVSEVRNGSREAKNERPANGDATGADSIRSSRRDRGPVQSRQTRACNGFDRDVVVNVVRAGSWSVLPRVPGRAARQAGGCDSSSAAPLALLSVLHKPTILKRERQRSRSARPRGVVGRAPVSLGTGSPDALGSRT